MLSNMAFMVLDTSSAPPFNGKITTQARVLCSQQNQHTKPWMGYRIKTQDAILGEFATERLVEIGPAETLTNMASKTVNQDYSFQDVALGVQRELLSYNRDAPAIYYDTPGEETASVALDAAVNISPITPAPTTSPTASPNIVTNPTIDIAVTAPAPSIVSVPDKAVSPHDIITTLVALALVKQPGDIAQDQTLKALCGGRSSTPFRLSQLGTNTRARTIDSSKRDHRQPHQGVWVSSRPTRKCGIGRPRLHSCRSWGWDQAWTLHQCLDQQNGHK